MSTPTLNRTECNALRGLAIIGIFLHNYCHWLGPIVKENEYQYIQRNVDWLHQVMASPDGWLPMHLLSFFGHYGVPVFLFLSAYGLVLKYESGPRLTQGAERFSITGRHLPNLGEGLRFVRYHYLKLFKMMIVGFVAFTMLDYLTPGPHHYQSLDIIAMLGMFNNVLPNPDRIIWPPILVLRSDAAALHHLPPLHLPSPLGFHRSADGSLPSASTVSLARR